MIPPPPAEFRGHPLGWRLNSAHELSDDAMDYLLDSYSHLAPEERSVLMSRIRRFPSRRLAPAIVRLLPKVAGSGRSLSEYASTALAVAGTLRASGESDVSPHVHELECAVLVAETARIQEAGHYMTEAAWRGTRARLQQLQRRGAGREEDWDALRSASLDIVRSLRGNECLYRGGSGVIDVVGLVVTPAVCEELLLLLDAWDEVGGLIRKRSGMPRRDLAALRATYFTVLSHGTEMQAERLFWWLASACGLTRDEHTIAQLDELARYSWRRFRKMPDLSERTLQDVARRFGIQLEEMR